MPVWTVANQKGGVGKTTTSVSLAGLLLERGHRVLMIDLDPHGSLTSYFGFNPDEVTTSAYQVFNAQKPLSREDINAQIVQTKFPDLFLLPTSPALATVERNMVGKEGLGLRISKCVQAIEEDYDYILIDCPPVLGVLMINALAACDHLIVPVQTEFLALKGLERMSKTLEMVQKARPKKLQVTIVPTMFDRRTQASVTTLNTLRKQYADELWRSAIPIDTKLRDASKRGELPSTADAEGRAIRVYKQLLQTLLEAKVTETNDSAQSAAKPVLNEAKETSTA